VDLTLQGTRSVRQIAEELGVTDSILYEWRRLFASRPGADTGTPQTGAEKDEEIRRLRAEVVRMREREIVLKKSVGILSETPESGMPRLKQ
jgi:transposase-like protein